MLATTGSQESLHTLVSIDMRTLLSRAPFMRICALHGLVGYVGFGSDESCVGTELAQQRGRVDRLTEFEASLCRTSTVGDSHGPNSMACHFFAVTINPLRSSTSPVFQCCFAATGGEGQPTHLN